jgi:hypothetical protein
VNVVCFLFCYCEKFIAIKLEEIKAKFEEVKEWQSFSVRFFFVYFLIEIIAHSKVLNVRLKILTKFIVVWKKKMNKKMKEIET